jgi:hypothetical protein
MPFRPFRRRPLTFLEYLGMRSYGDLFVLWILLNLLFAIFYFMLASLHPEHAPSGLALEQPATRLFDSLYFSIVTGTSTGYGDIVPQGASRLLAMIQTCMALLVFAIFVTKLVSSRTEATLREVHRMSLEGIFYHIRQVLFIVRKDIDGVLHALQQHRALTQRDWEILQTACLQAESLVEEIPELYNRSKTLTAIDLKRERLLLEALQRTLKRIDALLRELRERNVAWSEDNEDARHGLLGLLHAMGAVLGAWQVQSHDQLLSYQDLRTLTETLAAALERKA